MAYNNNKYIEEYKREHYDRIHVLMPKGTLDEIKKYTNKSVNSFVNAAIKKALTEAREE